MRPERESRLILAAVQARAKMHEFRAAEEDFVAFRRAPETLFPLAVGILHDAASAIADRFIDRVEGAVIPSAWEEDDGSIGQMARFSASFFDSYLEAQLDADLTTEFSLLCAASYYLADSVGSAIVVARRSEEPPLELYTPTLVVTVIVELFEAMETLLIVGAEKSYTRTCPESAPLPSLF